MAMPEAPWEVEGLTEEEYRRIVATLGRPPNPVELGMFGVMWSEHCSYKTSRPHLRTLPTEAPQVLVGPGENAGVVELGDGWAVALRIESHNSPSAIEPFQGAATGVGGILRDIFTMGARPIAVLDGLFFGAPDRGNVARTRYLFTQVVAGIAHYGNCTGVPTVGGQTHFHEAYAGNPLVNVMCIGLMPKERLVRGRAEGPGNAVFLVGARTGRDGIHGASLLASQEFQEAAEEKRPAVQVGDPFLEKLLIEACLELMETDAVVGVNDLGAAGLTSACSETAARAGSGMVIDIDRVLRRERGMNPYEVMLSESQERMLVIVEEGREGEVEAIFSRWQLNAVKIGEVTDDGRLRVLNGGAVVADVPARALTDEAPVYERPARRPAYLAETEAWAAGAHPDLDAAGGPELRQALLSMMGRLNLADKSWVYRQYDHMVQTNTVIPPGSDAAVLRVKGSRKGIAVTLDGNGRYTYLAPRRGGRLAVVEAALNLAVSGARPLGITNCLNFGNPEKPPIMWQFREAVAGMREACDALDIPVTGGNVSFYNETLGRPVYPTPTVGMVGSLDEVGAALRQGFLAPADAIYLLGRHRPRLGGSEYLAALHGVVAGRPADPDLEAVRRLLVGLAALHADGLLRSAHDVAEGGLLTALVEAGLTAPDGPLGLSVEFPVADRLDRALFGEGAGAVVVSVAPKHEERFQVRAAELDVPAARLGQVQTGEVQLRLTGAATLKARWRCDELAEVWRRALPAFAGGVERQEHEGEAGPHE